MSPYPSTDRGIGECAVGSLRLRGRQSAVVYLAPVGHTVVLGTAGTGKTVMAMLRSRYLSDPNTDNYGPVLLATYNNALVSYIRRQQGKDFAQVQVETYARFARGYLNSRNLMPSNYNSIVKPQRKRVLIEAAVRTVASKYKPHKFFENDIDFFQDEIAWISGMGIADLPSYLQVDRVGRGTGLNDGHRKVIWSILENYRSRRAAAGYLYDWNDIATAVRRELATDETPRIYKHIVIDEGQDLSPEMIRSLVDAVDPSGSVTFFGDYAQQIYGQALSWRSCSLNIKKIELFRDNYRNTAAIARLAIAMSKMPHFGGAKEDLVEPIAPTAQGSPPSVVACRNIQEEIRFVQTQATALSQINSVAVLARTWNDAKRAVAGLRAKPIKDDMNRWDDSPGIYYGTYHSAKGLEFDAVIMPFCGATTVPLPEVVAAFGDEDSFAREAKLLYVAVTRARSDLIITYSADHDVLTPLLPTEPGLYAMVTQ